MRMKCLWCRKALSSKRNRKFCSTKCAGLGKTKHYKRWCKQCNKMFMVPKHRRKTVKFCSNDCKDKSKCLTHKFESKCNTCGKSLDLFVTRRNEESKTHYCNKKCFNNRGKNAHGGWVIKYCNECGKKLLRTKFNVNAKDKKGIKTYHCSRKCLFQYQVKLRNSGPNKSERKLMKLLRGSRFHFVGHFKISIGGKYPDFISKRRRKVIEFFGEHWHRKSDEKKRIAHFKKHGYECLIIWGRDLKYRPHIVRRKLATFIR